MSVGRFCGGSQETACRTYSALLPTAPCSRTHCRTKAPNRSRGGTSCDRGRPARASDRSILPSTGALPATESDSSRLPPIARSHPCTVAPPACCAGIRLRRLSLARASAARWLRVDRLPAQVSRALAPDTALKEEGKRLKPRFRVRAFQMNISSCGTGRRSSRPPPFLRPRPLNRNSSPTVIPCISPES